MRPLKVTATSLALLFAATACSSSGGLEINEVDIPEPLPQGADFSPDLTEATTEEDCGGFNRTESFDPGGVTAADARSELDDSDVIRIGVSQTTNLMGYRDPASGELGGFDVDIARELAKAIGGDDVNIRWVPMTSQDRVPALENNEVDFVVRTMTMTCQRWESVDFSSEYYAATQRLLVDVNSGISGLSALTEDHRVCSSAGSTSLPQIIAETPAQAVTLDDFNDCISLLQRGTVDAFTTDDVILAGLSTQDPNLEVVGDPIADEPYGVAVAKGNEDLVRFINATLENMRSDGRWDDVYDDWLSSTLGDSQPPKARYQD
ncbi:glutamate ABC transporter substrate-binding protein [Haloglycomyces albus]|uniref:glutamate ABC transporter substrate-binding protein n=1 Tax=Haloglycomyces albus TaxID=526067 RepID=UPI00046CA464|nr:glutamate ABC transporter substrate-binding protein [Haloglycomyces albus]